jgi:hypothetical protein
MILSSCHQTKNWSYEQEIRCWYALSMVFKVLGPIGRFAGFKDELDLPLRSLGTRP